MGVGGNIQSFKTRRQRPLVLEVRDELERMILSGAIPAGARLNENTLAEQMGVSRGPVREAARSLEREGLVETVANRGVYVRELSIEDALELYDLRALIAGYLCARLAESATQSVLDDLKALVAGMEAAIEAEEEQRYFELNLAFHDRIAAAAGKDRAATLYVALGKEVRLLRLRVLTGDASLRLSHKDHQRIVDAIESRDATRAQLEGARHHENGKRRLLETLAADEAVSSVPVEAADLGTSAPDTRLPRST